MTAHLAILWHQKHTDFAGPGKTEDTIHGSRLWPQYMAKSVGLFCFVAAALAGLGGLAQINPVWIYGPYNPAAVSSGSQPDWYIGWLDGALRVMPPVEIRLWHHTIPNPFFPGVLMPGITFGLLYAWPFLEARFTKDRVAHNLLDRPRDRPLRTAFGAATLSFYTVLFLAAGTDILATTFGVSFEALLITFQISCVAAPIIVGGLTWRICRELSGQRIHPIGRAGRRGGGARRRRRLRGGRRRQGDGGAGRLERRSQRQAAGAAVGPNGEHLMDRGAALLEVDGAGRHVQPPDPGPTKADGLDSRIPVRFQVGDPRPEGEAVMLTQALDVTDLEAGSLHGRDHRRRPRAAHRQGTRSDR